MKRFISKGLQASILAFCLISSHAANAHTISFVRSWVALEKDGHFNSNPKFLYLLWGEGRFANQPGLFYQGILQGQLGYQAGPNTSLWFGYGYIPTTVFRYSKRLNFYSQRIFQQVNHVISDSSRNEFISRSRLEERQLNGYGGISLRFRERIVWEVKHLIIHNQYTPILSDELFINVTHPRWVTSNDINQNRFFAGVGFKCFNQQYCYVGYLNQYIIGSKNNIMNHIIAMGLSL